MLSPSEFIVGNIGSAKPLSLILPIHKDDAPLLVGQTDGAAAAVILSGKYQSYCIESEGNDRWCGVIIQNVRIEVDETSLTDIAHNDASSMFVIRTNTRLVIPAKHQKAYGRTTLVTLHDNLASVGEFRATFAKWQVVVGEGRNTRVVWSTTDDSNS